MMKLSSLLIILFLSFYFTPKLLSAPIYPDATTNKAEGRPDGVVDSADSLKNVDVTQPSPLKESDREKYFYKYEEEFSFSDLLDFVSASDGSFPAYGGFGGTFLWRSLSRFHVESGAEVLASSEGHVWVAGRTVLNFSDRLRPFYSLGLGLRLRADRPLANFLDLTNYYFRGAVGFEYSLTSRLSLRFEVFGGVDTLGRTVAGPSAGLAYAF
jgi:hypothetical protein